MGTFSIRVEYKVYDIYSIEYKKKIVYHNVNKYCIQIKDVNKGMNTIDHSDWFINIFLKYIYSYAILTIINR